MQIIVRAALTAIVLWMATTGAATVAADSGKGVPGQSVTRLPGAKQQQVPRPACPSPDGPQPDGAMRCQMCPAAPGSRVTYRPMQCSNGKWIEAGPCADGDCAGRTY
jgi:hypothetical protein